MPLALDQAGAYIEEQCLTLAEYLALYQDEKATLLATRGELANDHPSVMVTFSLAFQKVAEQSAAAADLVRVCAFLAPDDIPEEIFTTGAMEFGEHLSPAANSKQVLNEALAAGTRYSLVSRNRHRQTLTIHRLVQEVLKAEMEWAEQMQWAGRVMNGVTRVLPDGGYENWPQCERVFAHALVISRLTSEYGLESETAALLLSRMGDYQYWQGRYVEAEPLFIEALAMRKQLFGREHSDVAASLNHLAGLYHSKGQYSEAEPLYREALEIGERLLGENHPFVANSLNDLAGLYCDQKRYGEAEPLYLATLDIRKQLFGEEHFDVATTLNNLALLYRAQGRYTEAESLFKATLDQKQRLLGENHPSIATTLNNLALLYRDQERYDEAEFLFQAALDLDKKLLGQEHPIVATITHNLAVLYRIQGRSSEAEPLFRVSLDLRKQLFGETHPDVTTSLEQINLLYQDLNKI